MRKNPHCRILKMKPKKQYLNTVPKSYSFLNMYHIVILKYFNSNFFMLWVGTNYFEKLRMP